MDTKKIDQVLQYILLLAAQEERLGDRQLGPIHLIKYLYLADLAYAQYMEGKTYTGAKWKFYKFGPWAFEVFERIESALIEINAEKIVQPSNFEDQDEWIRWRATDISKIEQLESQIPLPITSALKKYVREYCNYTSDLLAYVYRTRPMLCAAPNEYLDFSKAKETASSSPHELSEGTPLTKKQQKKLEQKMRSLRAKLRDKDRLRDKGKKGKLVKPVRSPRYDETYFEGLKWLDSIAGLELPRGEFEAIFDKSIWKSPARTKDELSD